MGIPVENHGKYTMKLTNGGVVERNEVLFHDDRVIIILKDDIIPLIPSPVAIKQEPTPTINNSSGNNNDDTRTKIKRE